MTAECSWCGAECDRVVRDRAGSEFCSRSHRDQSTAAVKRLRDRIDGTISDIDYAALWRSLTPAMRNEFWRCQRGQLCSSDAARGTFRGLRSRGVLAPLHWELTDLGEALARWAAEHGEAVDHG